MKKRRDLILIVASTVVGTLIWLGLLGLIWRAIEQNGPDTDPWAMIEAVSTAVTAAAVLSAGFVAYRELSEISQTRQMEVIDRLLEDMNSLENIEARRWIYLNLDPDPATGMKNLTPEGQAAIKRVLNSMDRIALLTQPGWVDEDLYMPWLNPMIVKIWEKLEPYVNHEREIRAEPDYYQLASHCGTRCRAWREQHLGQSRVKWIEGAL